jgi:hypothetical protein
MEDVNFPLDQGQVSSALRGLQESREESTRPRRLEDNADELDNAGQARDEEEAQQASQAERTVIAEDRVDVAEQTQQQTQGRQQDQTVADRVAENQEVEIQAQEEEQDGVAEETLQPLEVAREFGVDPRGGVPSAAEQVTDGFRSGNDVADPDRVNEFQNGSRIDSVQEGTSRAVEDATSPERENPARPLEGTPSIRDVSEDSGAGLRGREDLEETFNADPPSPEERSAENLEQRPEIDARVQQRVQEDRADEAETRVRNEPAFDAPAPEIDPVEPPEEPLQEAIDNNPLRGPKPSELREDDASAVETERGQNISSLI